MSHSNARAAGKRILITGAASGIAAATRAELEGLGADVVGLDRAETDDPKLLSCDVRDQAAVDAAVAEAIAILGGLDVLINCAGVATPQSAGLAPDERALAVVDINAFGPWRVTSAAIDTLVASQGRVVNVASGMAFVALPFAAAYAMSKHAVMAYSGALRLEYAGDITVTTVYPGVIKTPIHKDSEDFGLTLDGTSPVETLESAVNAITRGALEEKAPRDITTTTSGKVANSLSKYAPKRFVDSVILRTMAKKMVGKDWSAAEPPVGAFAARLARR